MSDEDKSQKTEEPTTKKIEDAAKKGQLANSREVSSFFLLMALACIIIILSPYIGANMKKLLLPFIQSPEAYQLDLGNFRRTMMDLIFSFLMNMAPIFALTVVAAIAASVIQNPPRVSYDSITPKLEKISPIKGFGRIFSRKSFVEFLKGILKIIIVGAVVSVVIWPYKESLRLLPNYSIEDIIIYIHSIATYIMIAVCCITAFIAAADFSYQKFEHIQKLKMSKQEIKDEHKQQDGDPKIKQKLRQIRMERAQNNMMASVPESDVVITNPTHYAIALKYDSNSMNAPILVAKGKDKVAARIRESAEKNKIPIIRNPPLARILHKEVELNETIPLAYYKAVAEVISYVYKLKGKSLG